MFDNLSQRLTGILSGLGRRGALSEADVDSAMREIRVALLEADVALPVVKTFIAAVREKAVGEEIVRSVKPGQMVVEIVHDHLVETLGGEEAVPLNLGSAPSVILMAGLQGSGKTTTAAKLALRLQKIQRKKVLLASLDVYRPAAMEQLQTLSVKIGAVMTPIVASEKPVAIAKRAYQQARLEGFDVLILDTAGRLHIDDTLMDEIRAINTVVPAGEILLVMDAMTGQDAANVALAFKEALPLTGLILTRVDSDARGGAALSLRQLTGCPIKFFGVGEKVENLEEFHPDRIAGRILGMGDIVSLVEKASAQVSEADAEKLAKRLEKGQFDLSDLLGQLRMMKKMGGLGSLMGMIPGLGGMKDQFNAGDAEKKLKSQEAIILSMTPKERKAPALIGASRKRRIAAGSGTTVPEVNRLLKQFDQMQSLIKKVGRMDKKQLMRMTNSLK